VTGIEVNSESYFPKLREYCPSAEGTRAIFFNALFLVKQLPNARTHKRTTTVLSLNVFLQQLQKRLQF